MPGSPSIYEVIITAEKVGSGILKLRQHVREGLYHDDYEPKTIAIKITVQG